MVGPAVDFDFRPHDVSVFHFSGNIYIYIKGSNYAQFGFYHGFGTLWYVFRGKKGYCQKKEKKEK